MTNLIAARMGPPGALIERELAARGWTHRDLALIMGQSEWIVDQIISGWFRITLYTAEGLQQAFGTSYELWLNMQKNYDDYLARQVK